MTGRRVRLAALALGCLAIVPACSRSSSSDASTTTGPGATAAANSETTAPAAQGTTSASTAQVAGLVPPGAALPADAECAARVRPAEEVRPDNEPFNATRGAQKQLDGRFLARVTGDYAGTTDEILQWAACKWGLDADLVRAQAAKESNWFMQAFGDFAKDAAACPPGHGIGEDGHAGECPESVGVLQVRYQYHGPPAGLATWPEAERSTAYNVDYAYAVWRTCFEGDSAWLNEADHVGTYAAGDAFGCLGVWFAGRWHTPEADAYIAAVRSNMTGRVWESASFRRGR